MKLSIYTLVLLIFVALVSCNDKDKIPEELQLLLDKDIEVPVYKKFSEIPSILPIPVKADLNIFSLKKDGMVKKSMEMKYSLLKDSEYNELERKLISFLKKESMVGALKMVTYARQLNAGHPYRITPYLPFFTYRDENVLFAAMGFGPAAVVSEVFQQKNMFKGMMPIYDFDKKIDIEFKVSFLPTSLPLTGQMFLLDLGELIKIEEAVESDMNILEDIIYHEFTHIWHGELQTKEIREKVSVYSNETDTGHDAMIVSNRYLAFSEGLAESTEALFGTVLSRYLQMSKDERKKFFGKFSQKLQQNLVFLKNRQNHIRHNNYVYNLYDFSKCLLRKIDATDAGDTPVGELRIIRKIQELLANNKEVTEANLQMLTRDFSDRFYGGDGELSNLDLMNNCSVDSPTRIEAKEGFVASVLYDLVYSGALVSQEDSEEGPTVLMGIKGAKKQLQLFTDNDYKRWVDGTLKKRMGRSVAAKRIQRVKESVMVSFRELVLSLKGSQAMTLRELLSYLFNDNQRLTPNMKTRIAYSILKVTHAKFTNDIKLKELFDVKGYKDIRKRKDEIDNYLLELSQLEQLEVVIELMDEAPEILVEYPSSIRGSLKQQTTRMNFNRAYHINLIEIFEDNSPPIADLAKKMDNGFFFKDKFELLAFAVTIDKEARIRKLLEDASNGVEKSVQNVKKYFNLNDLSREEKMLINPDKSKRDRDRSRIQFYNSVLTKLRKKKSLNQNFAD